MAKSYQTKNITKSYARSYEKKRVMYLSVDESVSLGGEDL